MSIELWHSSLDITSEIDDVQIGTIQQQLSPAAEAAGCYGRSVRNVLPPQGSPPDQRIGRVLAPAHRGDLQVRSQLSREILERVNGQIDSTFEKSFVDLSSEQRSAADTGERYFWSQITGGLDLYPLGLYTPAVEQGTDPFGLPQG
jgi:hypothetical protein